MAAQRNQLVFVALLALVVVAFAASTAPHATGGGVTSSHPAATQSGGRKLLTDTSTTITKSGTKSDYIPDWTSSVTVASTAPPADAAGDDGEIKATKSINVGDFSLDKVFALGG